MSVPTAIADSDAPRALVCRRVGRPVRHRQEPERRRGDPGPPALLAATLPPAFRFKPHVRHSRCGKKKIA